MNTTFVDLNVMNEQTGEVSKHTFKKSISKSNLKGGYVRMYINNYEDSLSHIVKSNLDLSIYFYIQGLFTKNRIEFALPTKGISKKLKTSQPKISMIIRNMVNIGTLLRVDRGIYRFNPYIYIPYRADGERLQKEWNELIQIEKEKKETGEYK